jgi:hypothetical protein
VTSPGAGPPGAGVDRRFLVVLAACCAGPMLVLVVLTAVLGLAVGTAAAVTVGVVAAGVCVAVMVVRHREGRD